MYVRRFEWETSSTVLSIRAPGWWRCLVRFRWHGFSGGNALQGMDFGMKSHPSFPFHPLCFMLALKDETLLPSLVSLPATGFPATMNSYSSGTVSFFCMLHVALITVFYHSKGKMTNTTCMATTKLANALHLCFLSLVFRESIAKLDWPKHPTLFINTHKQVLVQN